MVRGARTTPTRLVVGFLAVSAALLVASAAGAGSAKSGYDISYPQCGGRFPASALFGIVGVNGGRPYSANPCLGAGSGASELAWAEQWEPVAVLYLNTADPGPALSSHWPDGQTSPQECNTGTSPGLDTAGCSYDYGWNAAADSYADAVAAYGSLGRLAAGATQTPQPNEWWLDVETANSWEANTDNNVQALAGEAAYLQSQGVTAIGFYSSAAAWSTITGGTTVFSADASWLAGSGGARQAQTKCGTTGFTGGPVRYAQYSSGGFDADVRCF